MMRPCQTASTLNLHYIALHYTLYITLHCIALHRNTPRFVYLLDTGEMVVVAAERFDVAYVTMSDAMHVDAVRGTPVRGSVTRAHALRQV